MSHSAEKPQRRSVTVNGVKLSVIEAGQGDPVIYVHGVVTTSNIFPKYLGAYSPDFRGIAVDLRGYGNSEKPSSGFNLDQFSKDLIALADVLGIERAVWVGVSMGGMILQRLALDNPSRVRALVLVSTMDRSMILDEIPRPSASLAIIKRFPGTSSSVASRREPSRRSTSHFSIASPHGTRRSSVRPSVPCRSLISAVS